jgi:hypothetical protein
VPGPPPTGRPPAEVSPQLPPNPAPVGADVRYPPPTRIQQGGYYWTPSAEGNGVRLEPPVPSEPEKSGKLMPKIAGPSDQTKKQEPEAAPTLPVGIPQFHVAREQVAGGLKPSIDGLSWLHDAGYRTVLYIRKPGEDDAADRKQVEKRGLRYLSLELSPKTLTQAVLDEFSKIVGEAKNAPLFVYDTEGVLAGGLWYLYFRTVEKDSDEAARLKAGRLGLKEDAEGEGKAMWAAIQKLMSDRAAE